MQLTIVDRFEELWIILGCQTLVFHVEKKNRFMFFVIWQRGFIMDLFYPTVFQSISAFWIEKSIK